MGRTPALFHFGHAALLAVVCAALPAGCARRPAEGYAGAQPLRVEVSVERGAYRPGEMTLCEVHLRNVSERPLGVSPPFVVAGGAGSNIAFRLLDRDSGAFAERRPLEVEKRPSPPAPLDIEPGGAVSARFAFVDLTESIGRYALQVEYVGVPVDVNARPAASPDAAPAVGWAAFEVAGAVALRRGSGGLITEEEAVRVAAQGCELPMRSGRAVLVETEAGSALLDWWVTLECPGREPGESVLRGYLVSPYGGFVRKETEPFRVDPEEYLESRSRAEGQRRARSAGAAETTLPSSAEESP